MTAMRSSPWIDRHPLHAANPTRSPQVGTIRLYLRPERPGQTEEEIRLVAGTAAIVPRGRWQRIELATPSNIMVVTLPRGSRLEKRSEADA